MTKVQMYPNYWNHYYYEEGRDAIEMWRTCGAEVVYRNIITFDSAKEAAEYFENEC